LESGFQRITPPYRREVLVKIGEVPEQGSIALHGRKGYCLGSILEPEKEDALASLEEGGCNTLE